MTGSGPAIGWVTVSLKGKELLVKQPTKALEEKPEAPS